MTMTQHDYEETWDPHWTPTPQQVAEIAAMPDPVSIDPRATANKPQSGKPNKPKQKKDGDDSRPTVWDDNLSECFIPTALMSQYMQNGIKKVDIEPYDFILPGLMKKNVAVFAGGGGGGKSQHNLQAAICLCCGIDILNLFSIRGEEGDGFAMKKERRVIYVTIEDDAETIMRRLYAIFRFLKENDQKPMFKGLKLDDIMQKVLNNFKVLDLSGKGARAWFYCVQDSFSQRQAIINRAARAFEGFDLVIVDTLRRAYNADENNSSSAATLMAVFEEIAAIENCAVMLIAHVTKEASLTGALEIEGVRGSSVFKDNARFGAILAPLGIQKDGKTTITVDEDIKRRFVQFALPKANKIPPFAPFFLERSMGGVLFRTDQKVKDLIKRSAKPRGAITEDPTENHMAQALKDGENHKQQPFNVLPKTKATGTTTRRGRA
jgi:regulatory protein RepA